MRPFMPGTRPFGGFTNQDRTRRHESITAEWRGDARPITGDVAVRRDIFNRFQDATSVRASLLGQDRRRVFARRLLCGRHCPADLLRPVRFFPREFRRQSRSQAGKLSRVRAVAALSPRALRSVADRLSPAPARRDRQQRDLHQRAERAGKQPASRASKPRSTGSSRTSCGFRPIMPISRPPSPTL